MAVPTAGLLSIHAMIGPSVFGGLDSGLDSGLDCGTGLTESCAHHFEASNATKILT